MFTSIVRRRLLVALASSATRSLRFSCRAAPLTATASVVQYVESTLEQEKPSEAVRLPGSNLLSHEFLIRQSCAVSSESASTVLTHVVVAIQDSVDKYLKIMSELANLFDDSVLALTDEGSGRVSELQRESGELKKQVQDLEMLFVFVRKLLDANAEVCFLAGADFASTQASERLFSAEKTVSSLLEKVQLLELELARAQQSHIDKTAKVLEAMEKETTEKAQ